MQLVQLWPQPVSLQLFRSQSAIMPLALLALRLAGYALSAKRTTKWPRMLLLDPPRECSLSCIPVPNPATHVFLSNALCIPYHIYNSVILCASYNPYKMTNPY